MQVMKGGEGQKKLNDNLLLAEKTTYYFAVRGLFDVNILSSYELWFHDPA